MKTQKSILTTIVVVNLIVSIFFVVKNIQSEKQYASVDSLRLFQEFNMTKELNKKGQKKIDSCKKTIDSLYNIMESTLQTSEKEQLSKQIALQNINIADINKNFSSEASLQIWKRIQGYTTSFGQEKGYKIIFGAQPNLNVIYSEESTDITTELLKYINNKYEGNK